ncbi:MAG: hypothetical protein KAW47_01335, partial [Thermoplasmatales archaeon]|nr:hypothetical protein [Thermoplasmatales archaeon]
LSVSLSSFWIVSTILTSGVGILMAKFIAEDVNDERVSSYLLNGQIIPLILAAAFIFILILLSLFVLPATKYSDLAMPLVIVFGSKRDSMVNYMIINKLEQLYFNLFKEGSRVKDKSFDLTKKRTSEQ